MITAQPSTNKANSWAILGILISWGTFWIFLLSPLGLLAWIGILIYLIIKKTRLKWYLIFSAWLFVPGCNFLTGTIRYATGTASLQGVGGPETFHGIDRETRVESTSSGCIFIGFEPFVFPANNAAVKLCTNLFGFQRGSYTGAFPTEEEAQEIIKSADTIILKRTGDFLQLTTAGQTVKVNTADLYRYRNSTGDFDTVVGKTIKNECFIFQRLDNKEIEDRKEIYLIDISQSKLLKTYFDH